MDFANHTYSGHDHASNPRGTQRLNTTNKSAQAQDNNLQIWALRNQELCFIFNVGASGVAAGLGGHLAYRQQGVMQRVLAQRELQKVAANRQANRPSRSQRSRHWRPRYSRNATDKGEASLGAADDEDVWQTVKQMQ
jgi:hypothetical protein